MENYMFSTGIEGYKIKDTEVGKVAQVTVRLRLEYSHGIYYFGIDPQEYMPHNTKIKKVIFSNIPLLLEGIKIELGERKQLTEYEQEFDGLPKHTFKHGRFDTAELNMEPINGKEADPVPILKLMFTVNVDRDLNDWLFCRMCTTVGMRLTRIAVQEELPFDPMKEINNRLGNNHKATLVPDSDEQSITVTSGNKSVKTTPSKLKKAAKLVKEHPEIVDQALQELSPEAEGMAKELDEKVEAA
ncbi:MAG: hypothetical protein V3U75_13195 [Methylococcaceae bacterium]